MHAGGGFFCHVVLGQWVLLLDVPCSEDGYIAGIVVLRYI